MARIFLSYAREDGGKAKALAGSLEKAGHEVWWDRHIHGGSEYAGEIQAALNNADVVLVMWSHASVGSEWVRDEAAEGRDSGRLLPVVIDSSKPPLGFRQRQSIDLSGWSGRGRPPNLDSLHAAVSAKSATGSRDHTSEDKPPKRISLARIAAGSLAVVIAALLLVLAWRFGADRLSGDRSETPTLAVLPFTDLSPDGDKAFFAEGVAEAILTILAREPGIKVLGRSTARQLQESGAEASEMRQALGITHVLEGSARSAGDQLRMSVRLVDASDGRQLWAEEYHRRLDNIFAVQDEIGKAVAQRLKGSFASTGRRVDQPTTVDAYTIYLAARAKVRDRQEQELRQALHLARQLIAAEPDYAPGHALYAEVIWFLSSDNYGQIPVERALEAATPHAARAIKLAPNAPEGYAALGLLMSARSAAKAERSVDLLRKAISLDPSRGELRLWLAVAYNKLGRNAEALEEYRRVYAMEPLWRASIRLYASALAHSGRRAEAVAVLNEFESRGGSPAAAAEQRADLAAHAGDLSAAAQFARRALQLELGSALPAALLAWIHYRVGLTDQASNIAAKEPLYSRLFYSGQHEELVREARTAGAAAWAHPDVAVAIGALARARDWRALEILYDRRPSSMEDICYDFGLPTVRVDQLMALNLALALQKVGRAPEASSFMQCIRRRLQAQSKGPVLSPHFNKGSLAFYRAQLLAIGGERLGALVELERAIALGWVGQWPDLASYPAFDALQPAPEFAKLQARLNQRIASERQQLVQQRS